jgi:acyl-CoA reductase-like NAD-dependent aldehyde dehydrogenase
MPRSLDEILARSEQLADEFESYDPGPGDRDTVSPVTAVRLAAYRRAEAERELADAIAAARQERTSWKVIGELVGTSGEAARQRYGKHVGD